MNSLTTILWIGVVTAAPFVLFYQFLAINKRTRVTIPSRSKTILKYASAVLSIAYVIVAVGTWIYFWTIFEPDMSPTTSFSPNDQRLLGIASLDTVLFLFGAPIVAAFLAAYRDSFKKQP